MPTSSPGKRRSRYGFVLFFAGSLVVALTLLRLVIFAQFTPGMALSAGEIARALLTGLHRDIVVAVFATLPLLLWFRFMPERWTASGWHRTLFVGGFFLFWFAQIFIFAVEFFFFEEFKSRFNTVAVDYLVYPKEVFVNIWDSYSIIPIVVACGLLSGGWLALAHALFKRMWGVPVPRGRRTAWLAGGIVLAAALAPTASLRPPKFSQDRVVNEMANNGTLSFIGAFFTRHLDYGAFYLTIPKAEAYQRVRRMLGGPGVAFVDNPESIQRRIAGDTNRPRLNVVIILEESLGAEFFGCLGRKDPALTLDLTPEMDKLATEEGMLFTNMYATGNRTVRGMEGVLSSFPPLPGDSIVKRDHSDHVASLARTLQQDGYETVFFYGGRGVFDGMRSYAVRNGYDRFVEQKHFENPTFTTIWGVCDEDLFAHSIKELREMHQTGKPFFATLLTVSNHRPYTYPPGRIAEDPKKQWRVHAVKYTDFALGQFFKAAKQEAFWKDTIFVMVADHGARVYGSQSIPMRSYEIPLIIAGPAVVKAPQRIARLGGSMDVGPTILGLIGRPYDSVFMGRDLLNSPATEARVFLNHNRDIGMFAGDQMVVLGLQKAVQFYAGDPKLTEPKPVAQPSPANTELARDAVAGFQVADDLYVNERYRVE